MVIVGSMSVEELPSYTIDLEDTALMTTLEARCRLKSHLGESESLKENIEGNIAFLASRGLTPKDIYNNHRNMYMIFHSSNEKSPLAIELYDITLLRQQDWSCAGRDSKLITIGGVKAIIETHFNQNYNGYDRGDRDWMISTQFGAILLADLLPAQLGMFGFTQGRSSKYHLNLEQYLRVFQIGSTDGTPRPIQLLPTERIKIWREQMSMFSSHFYSVLQNLCSTR